MQTVLQAQLVAGGIGANVGEPARMGATARWFGKVPGDLRGIFVMFHKTRGYADLRDYW